MRKAETRVLMVIFRYFPLFSAIFRYNLLPFSPAIFLCHFPLPFSPAIFPYFPLFSPIFPYHFPL